MAVRILKHITVVCDKCQKLIAEFDVFIGSSGLENTGEVKCQECSKVESKVD